MEIKTIGRAVDNDVQINNSDISGHHVRITRLDATNFFVEDLGSANHTFVNDYPIRKATIGITDELRLSKDTIINLRSVFKIQPEQNKTQATESYKYIPEFWALKEVWETTLQRRKEINKKHQTKSAIIRTGIMVGIVGFCLLLTQIEELKELRMYLMVVSILAGGIAGIFVPVGNAAEEIQALNENLYRRFRCPLCKKPLGSQFSWNYYAQEGACPQCKASFIKHKQ